MDTGIYNSSDEKHLSVTAAQAKLRERILAFVIGFLAVGLAPAVFFIDRGFGEACFRDSISHYFYEPRAGIFFVMVLTFVGAFLFRYRGERWYDNWIASAGAAAAMMVAFFPTAEIGCSEGQVLDVRPAITVVSPGDAMPDTTQPSLTLPVTGETLIPNEDAVQGGFSEEDFNKRHFYGAIALFLVLLYFTTWAFMRQNAAKDVVDGKFTKIKLFRNGIYGVCAVVMVAGGVTILWGDDWFARPVFVGEAAFLSAFGVSWLVKSRFLWGTLDLRR